MAARRGLGERCGGGGRWSVRIWAPMLRVVERVAIVLGRMGGFS